MVKYLYKYLSLTTDKEYMQKKSKKYTNLGLRRDKNLSDVENPVLALNNLLNNIVNDNTKTFISEDLDAIRGIQNTAVNPAKLSDLANIKVQYSLQVGSTIQDFLVTPLVTLKDRIDNSKIITGETPAIAGGLGLLARFVPSSNVNVGTVSSTGDTIFTTASNQTQEVFWEGGDFSFPTFIDNSFTDQYGGIQWTGYFSPRARDPSPTITIGTTGLIIFEVDPNENNNWQTLRSFYSASRTVDVISNNAAAVPPTITVGTGQGMFVGITDYVSTSTNLVTAVAGDLITLTAPYTGGSTAAFIKTIGKDITVGDVTLPPVDIGNQIKIRVSYWYPNTHTPVPEKSLFFNYSGGRLSFSYLYAVKPSQVLGPYEIRQFLQDTVSPYQPNIGLSGNNKHLFVNNSLISDYYPKSSLAEILKTGPVAINCTTTNNLISSVSDLSAVEIGNILVPAAPRASTVITNSTIIQVRDTLSGSIKVLTSNIGNTIADTVNFIDHRGFIGWYYATSSGTIVTLPVNTTAGLRTGFVIVTNTSAPGEFKHIISLGTNTFTTNSALALTGEQVIYVYSDRSLIDTSKDIFCAGVFGQVLNTTANIGASSLVLNSVAGIAIGQIVQYSGSIADHTYITGISGNTISLSSALIGLIKGSSTIVFAPAGTGVNKEACVIPLDTAPPFVGVATGLSTSGKGIRSTSTNATLVVAVNNFFALVTPNTDVISFTTSTFDKKVIITSGGATYSILGTKF